MDDTRKVEVEFGKGPYHSPSILRVEIEHKNLPSTGNAGCEIIMAGAVIAAGIGGGLYKIAEVLQEVLK